MSKKICIEISAEEIKIIQQIKINEENSTEENYALKSKKISPNTLLELLSLAKEDKEFSRIGPFPSTIVDGCIGIDENSFKCVLFVKSEVFYTYYEKTEFKVPFPNMLFFFESHNHKIETTQVLCTKDSELNDHTELFLYPFGNVSVHGNTVCWGSNVLPCINTLKDFQTVPQLFINSIMNSDHYTDANLTQLPLREFLMSLEEKEQFPVETLKPIHTTLKNWLERVLD